MKSPLQVHSAPPISSMIFSEFSMSKRKASPALLVSSPRSTAPDTCLRDCLPADGRDLLGEVSTPGKVCVTPPLYDPEFDILIGLPELIGFPKEFCEALEKVGGCSLSLATKLLSSHQTDGGEFVAGQLCATEEQRKYYSQTLDAGPMVTRWMTTGYELPFSSIPPNPLPAKRLCTLTLASLLHKLIDRLK